MKKKHNPKLGPLGIVFAFLLVVAASIYIAGKNDPSYIPPSTSMQEQTKTYQSKNLKFSVDLVDNLEAKDLGISVSLVGSNGEIKIFRNGTQYSDILSYLIYFDKLRGVSQIEAKEFVFYNNPVLRRTEKTPDGNRLAYYIMINNFIYTLSTSSPSLYADLDKIAQSFRYTP